MSTVIGILVFVYGLVLGSFYNVVIYRVPLDLNIAKGRSFCPNCHHSLGAIDLVPVFSWVALKGKCRYCQVPISPVYPLVELLTGFLFLLAYLKTGFDLSLVLYCSFFSMLIITALIDLAHMVIIDSVLYVFSGISAVCLLVMRAPLLSHLLGLAAGFGLYLLIYWGAKLVYKKEAFGFGDVMLMGAMGLVLGLKLTILAAFLSFYVAIMFILGLKLLGKKIQLREEIPFGPYMCIAGIITLMWGNQMIDWYVRMFF